jgi:hypothetical protein
LGSNPRSRRETRNEDRLGRLGCVEHRRSAINLELFTLYPAFLADLLGHES